LYAEWLSGSRVVFWICGCGSPVLCTTCINDVKSASAVVKSTGQVFLVILISVILIIIIIIIKYRVIMFIFFSSQAV